MKKYAFRVYLGNFFLTFLICIEVVTVLLQSRALQLTLSNIFHMYIINNNIDFIVVVVLDGDLVVVI